MNFKLYVTFIEAPAKMEPEYVYDIYYAPGAILNADNEM